MQGSTNPFELSEQSKVTQYIHHSENIKVMNNFIYNKLLDKECKHLERVFRDKMNPEIEVEKSLYRRQTLFPLKRSCNPTYVSTTLP